MDTKARSVVKSITWRIIATTMTMAFSYIWLKDISSSLMLALSVNFVKSFVYYLHERIWNALNWGTRTIETKESFDEVDSADTPIVTAD